MSGQHLYREQGRGPTFCEEEGEAVESISSNEFSEQLGKATGCSVVFDMGPILLCALCATRFIAEESKERQ